MADRDQEFRPLYAVPPGSTLEEVLVDRGMTQTELARRMGRPLKTINEIIQAKAAITPETSIQLERVLGVPAEFWTNLERQYREDQARVKEIEALEKRTDWLDRFPLQDLQRRGHLPKTRDRATLLHYLLRFFGVASTGAWEELWLKPAAAFRRSKVFVASQEATASWLRAGALDAARIETSEYDQEAFLSFLRSAKSLTTQDPETFYRPLMDGCRLAGVAVVFLAPFAGTRVYGATQWVGQHNAVLQLSNRYKTDDHLWFTFFHEAGHIALHSHRETFVEGKDVSLDTGDQLEQEANEFAADQLIPKEEWTRFVATNPSTLTGVSAFAKRLGISPGVVVGRLQHEGAWPYTQGNGLKRRFTLEGAEA